MTTEPKSLSAEDVAGLVEGPHQDPRFGPALARVLGNTPVAVLNDLDLVLTLYRQALSSIARERDEAEWALSAAERRIARMVVEDTLVADLHAAIARAETAEARVKELEARPVDWLALTGFAPWLWADPAYDTVGEKPAYAEARLAEPMNRAQDFTPSQYALVLRWDLSSIRSELHWRRAQVESLRRTRDAAKARISSLEGEVKMVVEALRPFAEACAHLHPLHPDDGETLDGFKVSDFRRAAKVFASLSQEGGGK